MRTFICQLRGFIFTPRFVFVRHNQISSLDPFKKRTHVPFKVEHESRIASRICITVLGNGGIGQPRCVGLFTEFKGYLFNCGEGVGRYCREYEVNIALIKHVFITQKKWENISGLSDIYLTNQTMGLHHMSLYGPPGVEQFLAMQSSKVLDTKILKKEGGYIDHTLNIDCIPLISEKEPFTLPINYKKNHLSRDEPDVYCYACKIFEKPGDLLIEKCIEHGVPVGPELLKLKNWENIVLPCGKTIYAEDVHAPSYPERIILIVDCPSKSFLGSLISENKFRKYQMPSHIASEISVFHFTPSSVFKSDEYQDWMSRFPETTEHIVLNSDNSITGSNVVHQSLKYFNLLHPKIFRKLREKEVEPERKSFISDKLLYSPPMLQIHIRPKKEFSWANVFQEEEDLNISVNGRDILRTSSKFYENLQDLKKTILHKALLNVGTNIYPEVIFLGTSSAASTAYRNVSGILLNTSFENSILLDCGEGTLMQLIRYFGSDANMALKKISCIFISHRHLDHYMGLFHLISQRIEAFKNTGEQYKPVALILPFDIHRIFMRFCEAFEDLYPAVKLFSCNYFKRRRNVLKQYLGDIEVLTVPVKHCGDAWGIAVELNSNWKIVYSGDTAPCQALIDTGKNCTLLIHEASIEDEKVNEALAKKHSTPLQVIDIAEKMNAKYTIMTHFSKRYLGFPILPEKTSKEIACAFDFMKIQRNDLPLLPLFTPVIKCLFEEQMDFYKESVISVDSFENAFLKVLKN